MWLWVERIDGLMKALLTGKFQCLKVITQKKHNEYAPSLILGIFCQVKIFLSSFTLKKRKLQLPIG